MDRAYQSGAAGSAPAAPVSPSIGYPTAGNPATATPATKPGPYWYHMIMEELMAIISAAGITPAQGNLTQLLTALRSAGVFQTPAQFDNTSKAATSAFVQRALGNISGVIASNGTLALTQLDCGKLIVGNVAGTITLPSGGATASGAAILVQSIVAGVVVARNGSDNIFPGGSTLTSIPMGVGDWCLFIWFPGYGWVAYGTPTLQYSSQSVLGPGQTSQNVTVSRALNTNYTNASTKPIVVRVLANAVSAGASVGLLTAGVESAVSTAQTGGQAVGVTGVVMPGETYQALSSGSVTLTSWYEVK